MDTYPIINIDIPSNPESKIKSWRPCPISHGYVQSIFVMALLSIAKKKNHLTNIEMHDVAVEHLHMHKEV